MQIAKMILSPQSAVDNAERWEQEGFDAILTNESNHDPFVLSTVAALGTNKAEIFTYLTVAFARNPMLAAHSGNDVNQLSHGRFTLGLGSQIKPHIQRRYNMPWSHPAPRMKEFIQAMHAIWDTWHDGKKLQFEGKFYRHNLMTYMFTPVENQYGRPRIGLGALGPEMTKVAAEIADDLLCHSFTTPRYMKQTTLPLVAETMQQHGRDRSKFRICGMPFTAIGDTDQELEEQIAHMRESVAFYISTPAYRGVLEAEGLEDMHSEFLNLSREGKWEEMGRLVTDEVLETFCAVGDSKRVARTLRDRYEGIFDLLSCYSGDGPGMTPSNFLHEFKSL
jgi:probable F420-dependent oxidoreductase